MKLKLILTMAVVCLVAGVAYAGGNAKVKICHIPPGNPANFHTITVNENALQAHLGHGDMPGGCFDNCETLCDDGNACTVDVCEPGTETCKVDRDPVDCDDGDLCSINSCDPDSGCQSAPVVCDDGDLCTIDMCSQFDGSCVATPLDCGADGLCLADTGQCDYPCAGISCDPIDQCHQPGTCFLNGGLADCLPGDPVDEGTPCDDGNSATSDDQCTVDGECVGVEETGSVFAEDDFATEREDTPVEIPVLDNDVALEGGLVPSTLQVVDPPPNGSVDVNPEGTLTYQPNEDWFGTDSFRYEVCNNLGDCDTATVTVVITEEPF